MRKQLRLRFGAFFRSRLLATRDSLHLTQEEMAHILSMSTRSYAALEGGHSCCGLLTLLLFLRRCCSDQQAFLRDLLAVFELVDQE